MPEGRFGEQAVIDNGGVARVTSVYDNSAIGAFGPGNLLLGQEQGQAGTLEVLSGGRLELDDTGSGVNGSVVIGGAGRGTLRVAAGGAIVADVLTLGGVPQSLLKLESGASLTVNGPVVLNARTQLADAVGEFSAAALTLGASHRLEAAISQSTFRSAEVQGIAQLGGVLAVDFQGIAPQPGGVWNLLEAGTILGEFAAVEAQGVGALQPGQVFGVRTVAADENRQVAQIFLEQFLTLTIDRATGAATLANLGDAPVSFDGYTLRSSGGALAPQNWQPLADNSATPGWQISNNFTPERLTETRPLGVTTLAGSAVSIGNVFLPQPTEFGADTEDLVFQYATPEGRVVDGLVQYVGTTNMNNLLLLIDPDTGAAQLRNPSKFDVAIDGYTISSTAGSLTPSWSGLADNAAAQANWQKSGNASPLRLTESNPTATETLAATTAVLDLGVLFNPEGPRDVIFQFLLAGESTPMTGKVLYGTLASEGFEADFDGDGRVGGDDLLIWQRGFGRTDGPAKGQGDANGDGVIDGSDYDVWQTQFGPPTPMATAVPEPTGGVALAAACLSAASARKRRSAAF